MAEGGGEFVATSEEYEYIASQLPDEFKEVNTTGPFKPSQASTPYAETIHMQTRHYEHSGLPDTSYQETSFGGDERTPLIEEDSFEDIRRRLDALRQNPVTGILDVSKNEVPNLKEDFLPVEFKNEQIERAKIFIKKSYPHFSEKELVIGFSKKKTLVLVVKGPKGGETPIFLKDGSDFQESFLNKTFVKKALGKPAPLLISQANERSKKEQKNLGEVRQNERRYRLQIEEKEKEENDLQQRIQSEEEKLQQLQDDPDADKRLLEEKNP